MRILTLAVAALSAVTALALAQPAAAQYGMDKKKPAGTPELPQCAAPLGRAAIREPEHDWWTPLGLSHPETLIKLFAARSNCFRIVDRNMGLAMRREEAELGATGDLRRGSNVGKGQIAAADFFIIPDISNSNSNAGGNNLGAAVGGLLGSRFGPVGALAGGVRTKRSEAQATITLVDARTTELVYAAEGTAQKTDVGFEVGGGGYGWSGFAAAAGGGYSNTEIGKVISAAYFNAFVDLVHHLQSGGVPTGEQASRAAGVQAYHVTQNLIMHEGPTPRSAKVRDFAPGELVYPTGQKNGVWWEVEDENGNKGWLSSTMITPR